MEQNARLLHVPADGRLRAVLRRLPLLRLPELVYLGLLDASHLGHSNQHL